MLNKQQRQSIISSLIMQTEQEAYAVEVQLTVQRKTGGDPETIKRLEAAMERALKVVDGFKAELKALDE